MMEHQGRDEEEPAPPTVEKSHDQPDEDEPVDKEHVTMCGLLKVISDHTDTFTFIVDLDIPYLLSAHLL